MSYMPYVLSVIPVLIPNYCLTESQSLGTACAVYYQVIQFKKTCTINHDIDDLYVICPLGMKNLYTVQAGTNGKSNDDKNYNVCHSCNFNDGRDWFPECYLHGK